MTRAELILYATPSGPLAEALDRLYAEIRAAGPTTAQTYPPHCTLTGFFRRAESDIARVVAELRLALADSDGPPAGAVQLSALHRRADWVGLELTSDWLHDVTRRFVDIHALGDGDDPLRPKDWLHLSIAYGAADLSTAIEHTAGFDIDLPVQWDVGIWRRHHDGTWSQPPG